MKFSSFLIPVLLIFSSALVFAGGFTLSVEKPDKAFTEKHQDSYFIISPLGCHNPAEANITVTAEGIIDGKIQSLMIEVIKDGKVYFIKNELPTRGKWILHITGVYNGFTSSAVVTFDDKDRNKFSTKTFNRKIEKNEIRELLSI